MDERPEISDPSTQRALSRAHRALERELRALLDPGQAEDILRTAVSRVMDEDPDDPARRLRHLVGARLMDEVGGLLARVETAVRSDETPTLDVPLDIIDDPTSSDAPREESAVRRHWTRAPSMARCVNV